MVDVDRVSVPDLLQHRVLLRGRELEGQRRDERLLVDDRFPAQALKIVLFWSKLGFCWSKIGPCVGQHLDFLVKKWTLFWSKFGLLGQNMDFVLATI